MTKSCANFDSLLLNIQDGTVVHLQKWILKFKLLYLLNHISFCNEIRSVSGLNRPL